MAYRNKTYVIFDGDEDMWAYAYMKGWKANKRLSFDFGDAHALERLTERASEERVKRVLRIRFANAKLAVVLVGAFTRNLYRFVRWEIQVAISVDLPIVVANLNGHRGMDPERCPPILRGHFALHVPCKQAAVEAAINEFPQFYAQTPEYQRTLAGPAFLKPSFYSAAGIV